MIWILTIWIAYLYGEIFNANIKIRWKKSVWTEFNYPLTSLEHLLYCYTLYTLQDRNTRGEILGLCNNFRFYKPGAWPTVWCQTLTMKDNTDYELDAFHILKEDNFLKLKNRGSESIFFNQRARPIFHTMRPNFLLLFFWIPVWSFRCAPDQRERRIPVMVTSQECSPAGGLPSLLA